MTTVAVLADPPQPGAVLPALAESTPLTESETATLYEAMLRDVCRAVEMSGGELLVNYRSDDEDAPEGDDESAVATSLRESLAPVLERPDEVRYEVQVGSSFAGRVGNTVTHLLETEGVETAAVVEPTAVFLSRQTVDNAAMKLRRHDAVLGPASRGRVYYAGFRTPIDFADAFEPPAIETLTSRAVDADGSVDYLPMQPVLETATDLVTVLTQIRARERAERIRPAQTAAVLDDLALAVESVDGRPELVRE